MVYSPPKYTLSLLLLWIFFVAVPEVLAQENPPIPIEVEVRNSQGLNFGTFTVGAAGGSVMVDYTGTRTGINDVYLLGNSSHFAIFDVYANPGTVVQIQNRSEITLDGPSGSNVRLRIDLDRDLSTGRIFVTTAPAGQPNEVFVGGTLEIPNGEAGKAGQYNGRLHLNFIHQ